MDHVIVKMADGTPNETLERMKELNGEGSESEFYPNAWRVDLPAGKAVPEALALYQTLEGVEYAELDQSVTLDQACPGSEASLEMAHAFSPGPVAVGEEMTYAVVVLNHGPASAANAGAQVFVPEGARTISSSYRKGSDAGSCPPDADGAIRCRFGELGVGEVATLKVVLRATRPGPLSVTSEPSADNSGAVFEDTRNKTILVPDRCTLADTTGTGVLEGTPESDVICGFDGGDTIRAMGGDDTVYGASGNDTIYSGDGDDSAYGGPGKDSVHAGAGNDRIHGARGEDVLRVRDGVAGNDRAYGGPAKDTISADPGDRTRD